MGAQIEENARGFMEAAACRVCQWPGSREMAWGAVQLEGSARVELILKPARMIDALRAQLEQLQARGGVRCAAVFWWEEQALIGQSGPMRLRFDAQGCRLAPQDDQAQAQAQDASEG